jgi:hypothetical protein
MQKTGPTASVDIAFRRQCLTVNTGIYARRYGRAALALMPEGSAVRRRLAAELEWMNSERAWTPDDQRRIATLCAEILRHARRAPEPLEHWWWHAARLRELLRQYETVVAMERERRVSLDATWPSRPAQNRGKKTARLRARQRRQ